MKKTRFTEEQMVRIRGGVAEARAMSQQRSAFTHRRYPLTMVCASYRVPRATVYAQSGPADAAPPLARAKRGPKTAVSDVVLTDAIRQVLADGPFHGEGHRKMRVRRRMLPSPRLGAQRASAERPSPLSRMLSST